MKQRTTIALGILVALGVPGEYTAFSAPVSVTIQGYTGDAMEPFISKDGRYLFFNNRNDPSVNTDLYFATRIDDRTFAFQGPVAGANSPKLDAVASLDTLGNFYFVSTRSYDTTRSTIYTGTFDSGVVTHLRLVPGISRQRLGWVNFDAEISGDGQTLWFDDGRYGAFGLREATIVVADRRGNEFARKANSASILRTVNAEGLNYAPCISMDGLELFFTRSASIYRVTRRDTSEAFGIPQHVAAAQGFVEAPTLSRDGHSLYFHKRESGHFRLYLIRR